MAISELLPELPREPEPSILQLLCGVSAADTDEPMSPELALVAPPEERQRLLEQLPEPSYDEWLVQLRRRFEEEQEVPVTPVGLSRRERFAGFLVMTGMVLGSALPIALHVLVLR